MGYVKLVFFMVYTFLCQLVFSSSLPHLSPEDQALALLQFKNMFTINPNASDYCYDATDQEIQPYPRTLLWNKSTDCCSWDGVHCDETWEVTIPQCLGEMNVWKLDLSNNSLSGTIKTNFSIGNYFRVISLNGNKLTGKVQRSLINCKYLKLLDLGSNELNDTFPNWLGDLPDLQILSLKSNKLHGPIKSSGNTNLFPQLHIMDLSSNGFSGNLPVIFFGNLQAMKKIDESTRTPHYVSDQYTGYYAYLTTITTKGQDYDSVRILVSNMIINLSKNRFEGHIPSIVGDLVGLRTLNLSHSVLEGHIPASLQNLSVLESLDLSSNKISGEIPQQLASLTFLAVLNLSHNHLVGCIPKGEQFDTFENTSYQGNDGLRGLPLSKHCGSDDQATTPAELDQEEEEEEDSPMIRWQAALMGYGCGLVIGLPVVYIMLSTQYPTWFSTNDGPPSKDQRHLRNKVAVLYRLSLT